MKNFHVIFIIAAFILNGLFPVFSHSADYSEEEEEVRIGNLFDLYMTESFVVLKDDNMVSKVEIVVDKIAQASAKPHIKYRVRIINSSLPIVSSFPGYVYISSGMLDLLENEDELAAVTAHSVAHAVEIEQYEAYATLWRIKQAGNITGHLMPLVVFSGVGAFAGAAAATAETIVMAEAGFYIASSSFQAATGTHLSEGSILINRAAPYLHLPDIKNKLATLVFLGEIYNGYNKDKELMADSLALGYLTKAGYDHGTMVAVLEKFSKYRDEYAAKGHMSHFMSARPGLEQRTENAKKIIENHK